jgi:alpha-galactosidase
LAKKRQEKSLPAKHNGMKRYAFLLLCLLVQNISSAQPYASWTKTQLTLNNGVVERVIQLPSGKGNFLTSTYKPLQGPFNYFDTTITDFQFEANDVVYSGKGEWSLTAIERCKDDNGGDGSAVSLLSSDGKIGLTVEFLLYPGLPVIRKKLVIKNLSPQVIKLESIDVEKFDISTYGAPTFSWVCHDYGRRWSIGPYDGSMQDALVIVHNSDWQQGIVIGNEASGVIKHTSVFWNTLNITSGLTHKDARFPFRKYVAPGDSFVSPQIFTMVYNNHKDPDEILNTDVCAFVNNHLGIRLSLLQQKPTFVYNTWEPFGTNINEKLVMELAKAAAEAGMKEFVIDDGWQTNYGDWQIDSVKFPHGLKPVFDYIKSLGMKPGLWVSIGSASPESKVFKSHPEWFVRDKNGQLTSLHLDNEKSRFTACFSTGWYGYIRDILVKLAVDYGLEYMKLDFALVTSPYRYDPAASGCYATDHPGHQDHNESLYTNYEQVWKLFDALHAAKSTLFIDCTFEAMGGLQLVDYAMLKHAEGNWLSNFNGPDQNTDLRIRNMAWWRSPAMPATALVIGNPEMQDTGWDLHIKSCAGALPIMLGDPRQLPAADKKRYRAFADWLQLMDERYHIMSFRQDLPGFDEPKEGFWDGFERINTETKTGGIIGVFRHGARESRRLVTIAHLDPEWLYDVKEMDGKTITTQTGKGLNTKGFEVEMDRIYDGRLFEIGLHKANN